MNQESPFFKQAQSTMEGPSQSAEVKEVTDDLRNLLLDDNFSIELLLKQAQDKNMNLKQLRDQLVIHQQDLQQSSTEIFNNSYDRFFKLSQLVACLAEPIQHVVSPIENYSQKLSQLCQNHDRYLQDIDAKLSALEETSKNKLFAQRFVVLIRRRDRIFDRINQIDWLKYKLETSEPPPHGHSSDSIESKVLRDTVDRLSFELTFLHHEVCAIQPTSDELMSIKKTLQSSLDEAIALFSPRA